MYLIAELTNLDEADYLTMMQGLSIDSILASNSDDGKEEEEYDKGEEEYGEDNGIKESKIPPYHYPILCTSTNPFTLKWGKVLGGGEK